MKSPTFYEILGVTREASTEQIHDAYHARAKELYLRSPRNDVPFPALDLLTQAYDALKNDEFRAEYDEMLANKVPTPVVYSGGKRLRPGFFGTPRRELNLHIAIAIVAWLAHFFLFVRFDTQGNLEGSFIVIPTAILFVLFLYGKAMVASLVFALGCIGWFLHTTFIEGLNGFLSMIPVTVAVLMTLTIAADIHLRGWRYYSKYYNDIM